MGCMADDIKGHKDVPAEAADGAAATVPEEEEVWGAVPLKEKVEVPIAPASSPAGGAREASQVSQEEVDALVKGLEGLDMLSDSIPDIPNLEEEVRGNQAPGGGGVSPMSDLDDIIASIQGTQFDLSPEPVVLPGDIPETRPASFPSLESGAGSFGAGKRSSLDLLMDIPVQLSVVLGRTRKTIGEVLSLEPGAIVELDRLAGEPVEVLANGKLVLKGEVVVIDESFGIRVTELVSKT